MKLYGASVCRDPNAMKNALSSFAGTGDTTHWKHFYNT